jgi:hypothetical protein
LIYEFLILGCVQDDRRVALYRSRANSAKRKVGRQFREQKLTTSQQILSFKD